MSDISFNNLQNNKPEVGKFGDRFNRKSGAQATPSQQQSAANNGGGEENERLSFSFEFEREDYIPATETTWVKSRKEICGIISDSFRNGWQDYVGCNLIHDGVGNLFLQAIFGPTVVNPDGQVRCFEVTGNVVNKKDGIIERMNGALSIQKMRAYTLTQGGIDTLSDFVFATVHEKDKQGRVRDFSKTMAEFTTIPQMQMGYNGSPETYMVVYMDINKVLQKTWPFFKPRKNDIYYFRLVNSGNAKTGDPTDVLYKMTARSKKDNDQVLFDIGFFQQNPNMEIRWF